MMTRLVFWIALFLALMRPAAAADPAGEVSWSDLTRLDLRGAYQALLDNHPGTLAQIGDSQFRATLDTAYRDGLARAEKVRDQYGYTATLRAFATAFNDRHIYFLSKIKDPVPLWAGFAVGVRDGIWSVTRSDPAITGGDYTGWQLVSCDGRKTADLVRDRMIYITETSSEAALSRAAPALLMDFRNPLLAPLRRCRLEHGGTAVDVDLKWQNLTKAAALMLKAPTGSPGVAIWPVGKGVWIGLEKFDASAKAVAEEAWSRREELRRAPYVVIDMRGNHGGLSRYGNRIVSALFGEQVTALKTCDPSLRVTEQNIAAVERQARSIRSGGDEQTADLYERRISGMRRDLAAGKAMTGAPCSQGRPPEPVRHNPVYVVTDAACYSACLMIVDRVLRLGAIQIGQPTGYHNRYRDAGDVPLPSGLGTFHYVMGIEMDRAGPLGPFMPSIPYSGEISDNSAIEAWFLRNVAPK